VVLNVLGVFLLVRWGAQLPRSYALLGGLLMAVAPNPVHTGAATGVFRQPFGTAALLFSLPVLSRAVVIRKPGLGYALVLPISYAFVLAVYSELFPVLMLVTALVAVQALWRAHRLKITTYVLRAAVVVAACFVVLANVQIAKFVALFPIVTGIIVGWDVQWSALDFWAFGMGTRQAGVEAAVPVTAAMPVLLTLVATVLLVAGLARLLTHRFATALLAAVAVFGVMAGYYGFVAHNPWTGALGHTWSLYKVAQWAFPVVLAVQVVGIWVLTRHWRPWVTGGLVALVVLIALPTQAALA